MENSDFGVLNAKDYNKSLAKVELRRRDSMIDFLEGMPQFSTLSRISIGKFIKMLNHMKVYNN